MLQEAMVVHWARLYAPSALLELVNSARCPKRDVGTMGSSPTGLAEGMAWLQSCGMMAIFGVAESMARMPCAYLTDSPVRRLGRPRKQALVETKAALGIMTPAMTKSDLL